MSKHPLVIRDPEKINKEYTELIINIGQIEVELTILNERKQQLIGQQEALLGKVKELSDEMNEAQKELARKQAEERKKEETNDKG